MIKILVDDIIDLVNRQRDSQGMITRVDLRDEITTLLELHFKNNSVLDDVINSFCPDCGERGYKTNLTQDSYACKNCLAQWAE